MEFRVFRCLSLTDSLNYTGTASQLKETICGSGWWEAGMMFCSFRGRGAESESSASPSDGDHLIILNELQTNPSLAGGSTLWCSQSTHTLAWKEIFGSLINPSKHLLLLTTTLWNSGLAAAAPPGHAEELQRSPSGWIWTGSPESLVCFGRQGVFLPGWMHFRGKILGVFPRNISERTSWSLLAADPLQAQEWSEGVPFTGCSFSLKMQGKGSLGVVSSRQGLQTHTLQTGLPLPPALPTLAVKTWMWIFQLVTPHWKKNLRSEQ